MNLIDAIREALKAVWDFLKKIAVKVLNFVKNIKNWFLDPVRLIKLEENRNLLAASIKERLDSGNYNVVNCLFDKEKNELIEEDTVIIQCEQLDNETLSAFKDKDMIILR
jgi:hypothetical protein